MDIGTVILSPILGALFGTIFALLTTLWLQHRGQRENTTLSFIDEFHSTSFLKHRIAVSALRRKINSGLVSIDDVGKGFWYPGDEGAYAGADYDGMNEHQHLTAYIGFLVRLAHAYNKGRVDAEELAATIRTQYFWHGDIVNELSDTVRKQVAQSLGAEVPDWLKATDTINEILRYKPLPRPTTQLTNFSSAIQNHLEDNQAMQEAEDQKTIRNQSIHP